MSTIDNRVVEMNFDGSKFGAGVEKTMGALARLKAALTLGGANKGLQDINTAAQQFNSAPMEQGAGRIAGQFTAMQAIALGALASVGAKAVQIGTQVANSLTLAPVMQGFQEYETNMNSIQTILANTQAAGTGLNEVNAALDEMNHYSDQTIYNFSEMARNVGTFTAAGVNLDTATGAIKGIANLAALSGSNSQQAAGAMYQLSQEIAAGKVTLMGWNSVVNAGMGGTVFQRALAQTAVAMGKIDESAITLEGDMQNVKIAGESFRDSISAEGGGESWLTSDVLTNTLQQFTGDLTDAELAAQGFSAAQIEAIKKQAEMARGAATEVKTFSGLMDTLKEGVASGWSTTFRTVIGDFEEAKTLFTSISNTVGGFLGGIAERRNEMLGEWKKQGGRDALIEGLSAGFQALFAVMKPVIQAFRQIFPATTAEQLVSMTKTFRDFMQSLMPSAQTVENIRRTFAGLFAVLGIGWELIKAGVRFIADLLGQFELGSGAGGILAFTARIGDFLVALHQAIKAGDGFGRIFDTINKALSYPINAIKTFIGWISKLFDGMGGGGGSDWNTGGAAAAGMERLREILAPLGRLGEIVAIAWGKLADTFGNIVEFFAPLGMNIADFFSNFGTWIADAFGNIDYDKVMQGLQIGLGAGFAVILNRLASSLRNFNLFGSGNGGFLDTLKDGADAITGAIEGATGSLEAMQANLKASALLKIGAAIALLAAALWVIASIDPKKLIGALTAMATMFTMLGASMYAFSKIATPMQILKVNLMGAAMILLATAILILASAVKKLADLDNEGLKAGLIATTVLIFAMTQAVKGMNRHAAKMVSTGAGLILMAVAINILADAVEQIGGMRWQDIAQGIIATGILLRALSTFTNTVGDKMNIKTGVGLILLAAGIKIMASALEDMEDMRWQDMVQGLGAMAIMLRSMSTAIARMPANSAAKGLGLLILAAGMKLMASALEDMEDMRWQDMVQGVGAFAVMLRSMSVAISRMPKGSMLNAAGLLILAYAMRFMVDALKGMEDMRWQDMVQGIGSMAVMLRSMSTALARMPPHTILSAAALFIVAHSLEMLVDALKDISQMSTGELVQAIIGMSFALNIIGSAMNRMITALPGAAALFVVAASLRMLLPVLQAFSEMSLGELFMALGMLAGVFIVLGLAALIMAPVVPILLLLGIAIGVLGAGVFLAGAGILMLAGGLTVLAAAGAAGTAAIVAIVSGLIGLIPLVMEQIGLGIIAFAQVIATSGPAIVGAITTVLIALLDAIIAVIPKLIETLNVMLTAFIGFLYQNVPRLVQTGFDMLLALMNGIANNIGQIVDRAADIIVNFINGISRNLGRIIQAGIDLIISFMRGIGDGIRNNGAALADAAWDMATGIIEGIVDGLLSLGGEILDALWGILEGAWDSALDFFGISSPSKEGIWMGQMIDQGIANGLLQYSKVPERAAVGMAENVLGRMTKTISGLGEMISGDVDMQPVIVPVLDLSEVRSAAAGITSLLEAKPLSVDTSYVGAANASAGYRSNQEALEEQATTPDGEGITFIQNNTSPKALSQAEIYRQTRSQLSVAKEALKTNAD